MATSWVLLVTREYQVHLPPELYTSLEQAEDEARRCLSYLFGWRATSKRVSSAGAIRVGRRFMLHMLQFEFPDPWRAGALWLGAEWGGKSFPRMRTQLLPMDGWDARSWVTVRAIGRGGAVRATPWSVSGQYSRGEAVRHVSASRIKRVCGPWSGAGLIQEPPPG